MATLCDCPVGWCAEQERIPRANPGHPIVCRADRLAARAGWQWAGVREAPSAIAGDAALTAALSGRECRRPVDRATGEFAVRRAAHILAADVSPSDAIEVLAQVMRELEAMHQWARRAR
jgi:hypothetical protein